MKTKDFFDNVSDFFDNMTNAPAVISKRKVLLRKLLPSGAKTAVDLGCGTGADSISLGLNGMDVTGFDISGKMIKKAKMNSKKYNLKLNFFNYPVDNIPLRFNNSFDTAVSLGNSLALIDDKKIGKSIKKIFNILKPGGIFILQILNYSAIEKTGSRIVNITRNPLNTYVRFYDLFKMPLNFNILRFDNSNPDDFELHTTEVYPYDKKFLTSVLKKNGFEKILSYSSLNRDNFYNLKSKDLIIIAYKN
jgi:glycine/sarcosine N-methyltransferase